MPSRNTVYLMGHLGQDAEVRYTESGITKVSFSLATTRSWKVGDEWKETTDWHRVVAWRLSDKLIEVLKKGHLVDIEGRLETRSYDKEGETRYITEVVALRVNYLRAPHRTGPRDADVPPPSRGEAPPDDDEIPF